MTAPAVLPPKARLAVALLRILPASMMFTHGAYRIADGGVSGFGEYLGSQGAPLGTVVAWTLTLVEVIGAPVLMAGRFVVPLCAWFMAELTMGILLVHRPNGWFVVGAGRNGMEYAFVLVCCFGITALMHTGLYDRRAPNPPAS